MKVEGSHVHVLRSSPSWPWGQREVAVPYALPALNAFNAPFYFSAKLKCLFALTVASSGLQLEVVLRKGQRLLDRGPYTGAWTEAALAPRAAAHRATPPSPAVPFNSNMHWKNNLRSTRQRFCEHSMHPFIFHKQASHSSKSQAPLPSGH